MLRFRGAGTFAPLLALALAACVDPKKDYDAFLARTADAETVPTISDDASIDVVGGDAAGYGNQQYVMGCVSSVTQDSVSSITLFVATASFVTSDSDGDGMFTFQDQPLNDTATDTTMIAGPPNPQTTTTVKGGKVDVVVGANTVPTADDPLGTGPIVFTDLTLHFVLGPGTNLCAGLSGDTTLPLATTLLANQNFCAFVAFEGTAGTVPTFTQNQFQCPGAPP